MAFVIVGSKANSLFSLSLSFLGGRLVEESNTYFIGL